MPKPVRHGTCMTIFFTKRFVMEGAGLLAIIPLCILALLAPSLEASTYAPPLKGGFIGLYCGISIIGFMKLREEMRPD